MTMTTQQAGTPQTKHIPLGATLQSARETMRLERKDAAAQLRLNESVIEMIENNSFPPSMPQIFVRGYIRSYGKLLQLPEDMIQAGLEPIKPPVIASLEPVVPSSINQIDIKRNYRGVMKIASAGIALTLVALAIVWWQAHSNNEPTTQALAAPEEISAPTPANNEQANTNESALPAGISVQQANQPLIPTPPAPPVATTNLNHNKEAQVSDVPAYKRAEHN